MSIEVEGISGMKKSVKISTFKVFVGILIMAFLVGATGLVLLYSLMQPVAKNQEEHVRFVVPKGQAITTIGKRLEAEGLIKNALVFRVVVEANNLSKLIQAGSFDLSANMSTSEIAHQLTVGTQDVWVTLLEGWRLEEIAESLDAQGLDFFDKAEFIALAQDSEGMLYPDTYLIPREMSTSNIKNMLTNTFERKVVQGLSEEIANSDRDFQSVLIMASLVEREAKTYEQMRRVAGILWNRIDIDMALQVDATLQYSSGFNTVQQSWWAPPTAAQKQIDSKFNTYLHPGLPPKPIANPGVDAIKATLLPIASKDLFYIHANDGMMYTAQTLEEHNANINKYLR